MKGTRGHAVHWEVDGPATPRAPPVSVPFRTPTAPYIAIAFDIDFI